MQMFENSVERLNSPVYSAPPCICSITLGQCKLISWIVMITVVSRPK